VTSPVTVAQSPVVNDGHIFTGTSQGRIRSDFVNRGLLLNPAFKVDGDVTLDPSGGVRVGGAWRHSHVMLEARDSALVDGALELESSEFGRYVVVWSDQVSGAFSSISIPPTLEPRRVRQAIEPFQGRIGMTIHVQRVCHCDISTGLYTLDIFDFLCFQNEFIAGEPTACDCDRSTGLGVCDIFDFLCFQDGFMMNCD
jgi:hypothetical protein